MIQNLWYLIAAYGVIWAALFAYVFGVDRRQKQLRDDLAALEAGIVVNGLDTDTQKEVVSSFP